MLSSLRLGPYALIQDGTGIFVQFKDNRLGPYALIHDGTGIFVQFKDNHLIMDLCTYNVCKR